MKTAFFLVLLANLTLLMYEYHRGAFGHVSDHEASNSAILQEPIVLATEQRSAQLATSTMPKSNEFVGVAPSSAINKEPPVSVCYQVGPFLNEQSYDTWNKQIGDVQGAVKPMPPKTQDILDYLVLYPISGGMENTKAVMQVLREKGISDAWPLTTGSHQGHISLGAFRRENRALLMQKDLQAKGIDALVKPRFKNTGHQYVVITASAAVADRLSELAKKYSNVHIKPLSNADPSCSGKPDGQAGEVVEQSPEQEKKNQMRGSVASVPEGAGIVKRVCYEAGPFPNEKSFSVWRAQIKGAQGAMMPIFRDAKEISDYLVLYLSGSPEKTKTNLQILRDHGIVDAWLVSTGDEKGQISLGVFHREENALQMQKKLLENGIESVVRPRYKNKRQRYALISGYESIDGGINALRKNQPDIKLRPLPDSEHACPNDFAGQF